MDGSVLVMASPLGWGGGGALDAGDVRPQHPVLDAVDGLPRDGVIGRHGSTGSLVGDDSQDLRVSQFGLGRCFALSPTDNFPALGHHVGHVVDVGAEEMMPRVDAATYVALVKDPQPIWDWPVLLFPCHAMRAVPLPVDLHASMPAFTDCPEPQAAPAVRFRHAVALKALRDCHDCSLRLMPRTCSSTSTAAAFSSATRSIQSARRMNRAPSS